MTNKAASVTDKIVFFIQFNLVRGQQPGQQGYGRQIGPVLHPVEAVGWRRIRQDLQERGHQQQPQPHLETLCHHVRDLSHSLLQRPIL